MSRALRAAAAAAIAFSTFAVWVRPAAAEVQVRDCCNGTDHFPDEPVGNAPSKQVFALTVPPELAGQTATIAISGPSGNQSGTGTVAADGRVEVDVPLFQYGEHTITSVTVGSDSVNPRVITPTGRFTVNDNEVVCTASQLQTIPASAASTTTTLAVATTTTRAPAAATTTTTLAAAPTSTQPVAAPTTTTEKVVEAAGTPASTSGDSDDGSLLFPGLIGAGALLVVVGGGLIARDRAKPDTTGSQQPVIDDDLRIALANEFPDTVATTTTAANIDEEWRHLVFRESQVQQRVEEEVQRTLDAVGAGLTAYMKALDDYRSRFALVMSSSTEMQGMLVEWDEVKQIARKQDLAFGIITLAWSGGSLGLKAVKWLRTPRVAAQAPRGAADFYRAYNEALQAGEQAAMARLAQEAGVDLTTWMGRFEDAESAGNALMRVVAERRGWVQIGDATESLINRLLVNGRSALNGRVATLAAEDLNRLRQLAQQPGFWERLGKAANWVEESARVGDRADPIDIVRLLYSGDDIALLKAFTESGDLARLADAVAVAGATEDATKTVLLGEDAVRTILGLGDDVTGTVLLDDLAKTQILDDPMAVTRILNGLDDTVILGAHEMPTMIWQPLKNADAATAATQILDASVTAPTVILQPGALAPTVILGGDDAARAATQLFGDAATAPTLLLNADAATAATHVFQPGALAPTVILNGEDAASATTRMFGAAWEQPTLLLHRGAETAPTLLLHGDDAANAATQMLGNPATMPTLLLSPDAATAGTFIFQTPSTMPTLLFHGDDAARAATQIFDSAATAPTLILQGDEALRATQILDAAGTAPTLILAPDAATAATQVFGRAATMPTLLQIGDGATAPTLILGGDDAARAATQLFQSPATMPTLLISPDAATAGTFIFESSYTAPTVVFPAAAIDDAANAATQLLGNPATMPTLLLHGDDAANAATQLFGSPASLPTLILSPDAIGAPTVLLRGESAMGAATQLLDGSGCVPTVILGVNDATQILPSLRIGAAPVAVDQGVLVGRAYPGGIGLYGTTAWEAASNGVNIESLVRTWLTPPTALGPTVQTASGIDIGMTIASNVGASPTDVHAAVFGAATARNRWHRLPVNVSGVIDRVLFATRQAIGGHGTISPDDVVQLKQWASRPGFYSDLARAADVGAGGAYLTYTEADLRMLQAVERNDGQVGAIREALGPLQVAATRTWRNQGDQAAQIFDAVGPMGQVGFEGFVDQFGITNRFKDGLGWAMAGVLWDGFTSPFQTWHQFRFTDRALDLMEGFQRTRGGDLIQLGNSLQDAVHALEGMQRGLTQARLDQPGSILGGRGAEELQDVLDGYRRAFDTAPDGFKNAHRGELDDRVGHIRQKLAQLQTVTNALRDLAASLPNMIAWIDSLRKNPDGSLRSVMGLFNPEAFVRLGSVGMALGQSITNGLLLDGGTEAPPPDAPDDWPPPSPPFDFPEDPSEGPLPEEQEPTMTDEQFEEYKRTH